MTKSKELTEPPALVGAERFQAMTGAERVAMLTALLDAIEERANWEKQAIIEQLAGATETTPIPSQYGNVTLTIGSRPRVIDQEALLAWVKEHAPERVHTVEEVDPDYKAALIKDLADIGDGEFVTATTGEIVDWVSLGPAPAPKVSYPSSRLQKATKYRARRVLAQHLGEIAAAVTDV